MKTKRTILLMIVGMLTALAAGAVTTVEAQEGKGVELGEAVVITAEVLAIDKEDRILTLLGPKGNVVDLEVGEEARISEGGEAGRLRGRGCRCGRNSSGH